jgi:hypothetical protein
MEFERLFVKPGSNTSVYEMKKEDLLPECSGTLGSATIIGQVMDDDCRVLTYSAPPWPRYGAARARSVPLRLEHSLGLRS